MAMACETHSISAIYFDHTCFVSSLASLWSDFASFPVMDQP